MGKAAVLIGGVIVISLLLLAAACTNEQVAKPLPKGSSGIAAVAPAASDMPSGKQDAGTPEPANQTKSNTTVETKHKPAVNATTPTANTTAAAAATNTTKANSLQGCFDTDYGQDIHIKGTVQYNEGNISVTKTDDCVGDQLREWYCDDSGSLAKAILVCSKTCIDGVCIS